MRLIDADALLQECARLQKLNPDASGRGYAQNFTNEGQEPSIEWWAMENVIEDAPTVDAVPKRIGRWVEEQRAGRECWHCSVCGMILWEGTGCMGWEYCPHCGADMGYGGGFWASRCRQTFSPDDGGRNE